MRGHDDLLYQGQGRQGRRGQVQDLRLRSGDRGVEHGERNGQGQDPGRSAPDHPGGGRGRAQGSAQAEISLLQPGSASPQQGGGRLSGEEGSRRGEKMKTKKEARREEEKLWCPYCEDDLASSQMPYCQPCKVETFNCPSCGKP